MMTHDHTPSRLRYFQIPTVQYFYYSVWDGPQELIRSQVALLTQRNYCSVVSLVVFNLPRETKQEHINRTTVQQS
jgi:hypothetical protein